MFASASQSSVLIPSYVRATASVRGRFERAGSATRLIDNYETGGLRVRIPSSGLECEAVVLNSAGGMAGGDLARLSFDAGRKSRVRVTTQSAEKIYRTDEQPVRISTDIKIGDAAQFAWIPQETILFDGSRLERTLTVEVAESATAILIEMTVFGRVARG